VRVSLNGYDVYLKASLPALYHRRPLSERHDAWQMDRRHQARRTRSERACSYGGTRSSGLAVFGCGLAAVLSTTEGEGAMSSETETRWRAVPVVVRSK